VIWLPLLLLLVGLVVSAVLADLTRCDLARSLAAAEAALREAEREP
jgi:hypothetical protein